MSKWFMPREPLPAAAGVRLFCFPYAGGGAGVFAPLRQFMDGVAAVQYPGRESRIFLSGIPDGSFFIARNIQSGSARFSGSFLPLLPWSRDRGICCRVLI